MKKVSFLLALSLFTGIGYAQSVESDSIIVYKLIDDMSDEIYLVPSRKMIVAEQNLETGFSLTASIDEKSGGLKTLLTVAVGLGSCHENDEIIILFENGEKIKIESWAKFNCDGKGYFDLSSEQIELLRNQPLSKVRLTNGKTFDSYTGEVEEKDKRYFIQILYSLDNKIYSTFEEE